MENERQFVAFVLRSLADQVLAGETEDFDIDWKAGSGVVNVNRKIRLAYPVKRLVGNFNVVLKDAP